MGASRVGIAAVEFALWDVQCKRAGMPLWHYLGAARDKVLAYSTDGGWLDWSVEDLVRDATALIDRGFHAVKIKLGREDPREDYDRIGAVRDAVGPKIRIMTDVNCAWTLNTARFWGGKLADFDVFWLEEPMVPENVKAHAELQRSISIPVAVGETIFTKYAFRDYIEQAPWGSCRRTPPSSWASTSGSRWRRSPAPTTCRSSPTPTCSRSSTSSSRRRRPTARCSRTATSPSRTSGSSPSTWWTGITSCRRSPGSGSS